MLLEKDVTPLRKRAVIYCRVSTDRQEIDGESLDYQEAKCKQYAELHDYDVIAVLSEAKSGYIHYSLREKLTIARQFVREGLADAIIVFDLRRFSRNFVHSAMIFEEIESSGGEIISVSENIDNSLTGKLIRSILAWSAESEREKIVEYANRHWQTRYEHNLPMGTGRAPYGWQWGDTDKTYYSIEAEEAAVRFSIFHMFVELDMSLRGIAHKLTEDGILPPAKSRGASVKGAGWRPSTVHMMLTDVANIGVLQILKYTATLTSAGKPGMKRNELMRTIPDGLPAIVPLVLYERAQRKLKTNRADKSHLHRNPEDFLLKGHVMCATCGYAMVGRYRTSRHTHTYPYYACVHNQNKYMACPDLTMVRTYKIDDIVWADCCRVFEQLEAVQSTIERHIRDSLQSMLENTHGSHQIAELKQEIAFAQDERDKHPKGSYYYLLTDKDVLDKLDKLRRYEAEYSESRNIVKLSEVYSNSMLGFLNFLNTMRGRYHEATFTERRNALEVLGVQVSIYPKNDGEVRTEVTYTPMFTGVQNSLG